MESAHSKNITVVLTGKLSLPLAPENISTIPLFHVQYNLWGRLLTEDAQPGLASLINVANEQKLFHFKIDPSARFSNGRSIISQDVDFSFRRLMEKQPAGHFSAKSLIKSIRILSDAEFEIELNEKTSAFLYLLSTPEMGIVPKEACDSKRDIQNLQITSGPYFVDGAPTEDQIDFKKNPYFSNKNERAPEHVTVLFRVGQEPILDAFRKEKADFMELYGTTSASVLDSLRAEQDLSSKITRPSFSVFVTTNPKRLTSDERLSIAEVLHRDLKYALNPEVEEKSSQLLPPSTFGSIPKQSIAPQIPAKRTLPKKLRLASVDSTGRLLSAILDALRGAGIEVELVSFQQAETADLGFLGQGMNTDFPEIEFYLNMLSEWKFIDATPSEKTLVMSTIHSADRRKREENIESISRSLLADARIIPLIVRSYVHIFKKNRIDVSPIADYDGDIPLWKMGVTQ